MVGMSELVPVICRDSACRRPFHVPSRQLGRNVYCLHCGKRMTARPAEVEQRLLERERSSAGGAGADLRRLPLRVIVDNVRSLWNVGSIFRTADACGVEELILTGITGCPPRPEIAKTALGAERMVRWRYAAEPAAALDALAGDGYLPVVLETGDEAVDVDRFPWPERVCLVIGNEVAGVAAELMTRDVQRVAIPMFGGKESLNVAVAFGIAAHAAARTLNARGAEREPGN